jgi:hypothetical protein
VVRTAAQSWGRLAAAVAVAATVRDLARLARHAGGASTLPRVRRGDAVASTAAPAGQRVSAVLPARDEAARLGRALNALCATGPELVEVLVVDDDSADATAAVARAAPDPRVRVLSAPPLVPGSVGKPAACAYGADAAAGAWLWFLDADVAVAPDALRRLLAAADEWQVPCVSAVGRLDVAGGAGALVLPELGFSMVAGGRLRASGQCLLVRRDVYDAVGGHDAVRGEVVEDLALAARIAAAGHGVRIAVAPDAYRVRMYDDRPALWAGLAKNTTYVRSGPLIEAVRVAPAVLPPLAAALGARRAAAMAYAVRVLGSAGCRAVSRTPVRWAPAAPLADVMLFAHYLAARRRRRHGRPVLWRGRPVLR